MYNQIGVVVILVAASISDFKDKIIPDKLLLLGVLAGMILYVINPFLPVGTLLLNTGIIAAALFLIYFLSKKALGLGDVKLITLLGLFVTISEVLAVAAVAVIFCGLWSALLLLLKRVKKDSAIPFAPFLLASSIYVFYFS